LASAAYNSLKEAFVTFVNLNQAEGKTIPSLVDIANHANAVINSKTDGSYSRLGHTLLQCLQHDTALELALGKPKKQEEFAGQLTLI
jgi:hypothetical protein